MFGANWKTTAAGLATILTAAGHLLTNVVAGDFSTFATDGILIISGLTGLFAKDNNVTGGTVKQPSK